MKQYDFTFDGESLVRLAALRGQPWKCFGAPTMGANLAGPFSVFFVTEEKAITVTSAVEYFDIDGDPYHTTIAELAVAQGADEQDQATKSGNVYVFHAGEVVVDAVIIRDTITEIRDGSHTWTIVKDVGVIFIMPGGVIAISQLGLHEELLQVTLAASVAGLKLPAIQRKWSDVLGIEHESSRQFIPVDELLLG
jgi:hypothetical protein